MSQPVNTRVRPNSEQPLVSVYMPTKNRLELVKRALESLFNQTYTNIEIIVVDDGSTDGTFDYLQSLIAENNKLIVLHNKVSLGACAARNKAINVAKGTFITGLDDDDQFLPDRIETLLKAYQPKYAFICSSMWWDYGKRKRIIDGKAKEISLSEQLDYNEATTQVFTETTRIKALNGFDESFVACQDYDLWTRLMVEYGSAYRIAHPSYIINDTGSSERMISSPNSVKGYQQFAQKHGAQMSLRNHHNHAFMMLRRQRLPMPFTMLCRQIGYGHFISKFRYFLSSNFKAIKNLHQKFYKNN